MQPEVLYVDPFHWVASSFPIALVVAVPFVTRKRGMVANSTVTNVVRINGTEMPTLRTQEWEERTRCEELGVKRAHRWLNATTLKRHGGCPIAGA
jgi:hypothetical protein